MSVPDFWICSLRDVVNVISGHEEEKIEALKWMRWQTAALINIHLSSRSKIKVTDLFKLDDDAPEKKPVDNELLKKINEKWDLEIAKKFNVNGQ